MSDDGFTAAETLFASSIYTWMKCNVMQSGYLWQPTLTSNKMINEILQVLITYANIEVIMSDR